jgi:hypothetical protein
MKKFSEWLLIKEAAAGGIRTSRAQDIVNVGIGKLSPYSTFGHTTRPGFVQTGASAVIGGIGERMRKELGPVQALNRLEKFDLSLFESNPTLEAEFPMQLPIVGGQILAQHLISTSSAITTFNNVRKLVGNPEKDGRVIKLTDESYEGKFELYDEKKHDKEESDYNFKLPLYTVAVEFTVALLKLKCYYGLKEKSQKKDIENTYNIENPKVIKRNLVEKNDKWVIQVLFEYKKLKTAVGDYNNEEF